MNRVLDRLERHGVERGDVQTTGLSMNAGLRLPPVLARRPSAATASPSAPGAGRASSSEGGRAVDRGRRRRAATTCGSATSGCGSATPTRSMKKARDAAVAEATAKAQQYAAAAGQELGDVVTLREVQRDARCATPRTATRRGAPGAMDSAAVPSRSGPARTGLTVTVRIVWASAEPVARSAISLRFGRSTAVLDSGAAARAPRPGGGPGLRPSRLRRLTRAHGNDERPEERHGAQPRRPALAGHLVPAPQARQGRRRRAHQAEERRVRQDRRQDLQRRRQGRGRQRRQAHDAVPLQRRHVLRLHGHRHLRPARDRPGDRRRRRRTSCWRTRRRSSPPTRAACSTSSCPRRSSSRSPTPSPASQGDRSTGRTKPATLETGHEIQVPLFITTRARRSRSTPATPPTWAASSPDEPLAPRPASARSTSSTPPRCAASPPIDALDGAIAEGEAPTNDYTVVLVRGVVEHRARIDELLATYAEGWTLDRMPAVDRNVLRLGVFELLYVDDVPDAVAVTEAMALVRDLSTDESPGVRQRRARRDHAQQGVPGLTPSARSAALGHAAGHERRHRARGPGRHRCRARGRGARQRCRRRPGSRWSVVDRHLVGGECPYYGCIPSKMMIRAADALAEAGRVDRSPATPTVTPVLGAGRAAHRRGGHHDWDDTIAVDRLQDAGATVHHGVGRLDGAGPGRGRARRRRRPSRTPRDAASCSTPAPGRPCRRSTASPARRTGPTATPSRVTELPASLVVLGGGADRLRAGPGLRALRRPGDGRRARPTGCSRRRAGGRARCSARSSPTRASGC